MRKPAVSLLLVGLLGAIVAHFLLRTPAQLHPVEGRTAEPRAPESPALDAAPEGHAEGASATDESAAGVDDDTIGFVGPSRGGLIERSVSVVGLDWEVLAPGLWANGGDTPSPSSRFTRRGVQTRISTGDTPLELERALARGGRLTDGADIAVVTLPTLVAMRADLEPLDPVVFAVTGWSRGQHAVCGQPGWQQPVLGSTDEISVAAERGSPALYLALTTLRLAGVDEARVHRVSPDSEEAEAAELAASETPARLGLTGNAAAPQSEHIVDTTAASRLIPYVAVAPRHFIEEHPRAVALLGLTWIEAAAAVADDVPAAAREVALIKGAPQPLDLIGPMSRIEAASLKDNARLAGLSGCSALTLSTLMADMDRTWRAGGVIASPPAPPTPASAETVAAMVRLAGASERAPRREWVTDVRGPMVDVLALGDTPQERATALAQVAANFPDSTLRILPSISAADLQAAVSWAEQRYDARPPALTRVPTPAPAPKHPPRAVRIPQIAPAPPASGTLEGADGTEEQ